MTDKTVYWDDEKRMFYWIEWEETGNNDIAHRHYITISNITQKDRKLIIDRIEVLKSLEWNDFIKQWVKDLYNELETIDKGIIKCTL